MYTTQIGDCLVVRRSAPTVESIKRSLVEHHFDAQGQQARALVLKTRVTIDAHLKEAWACGAVVVRGEDALRTGCGCRYCVEWGPIAEIELPVEQPDPAVRTQPADRGFRVAVARVPVEDWYRTTAKLQESCDVVAKRWRDTRES